MPGTVQSAATGGKEKVMAIHPTAEQLQELMKGPADTPVVMVNLLRFKPKADSSEGDVSGEEAYMRYGAKMREFIESKGGRFIWSGRVDSQLIGEGAEGFNVIALVEYSSRAEFLKVVGDPYVEKELSKHREAGLEMQWLIATTETQIGE